MSASLCFHALIKRFSLLCGCRSSRFVGTFGVLATLLACSLAPVMAQTAVQINCGSSSSVGSFSADKDFSGGSASSYSTIINTSCVTNAAPMAVYQSIRSGTSTFSYSIPGFTAGATCIVRLHFTEPTFTSSGQRLFTIVINSQTVASNFDIYAQAGSDRALVSTYSIQADPNGKVNISFTPTRSSALVCGIEVLPVASVLLATDYPAPMWAAGVTPMDAPGGGDAGPSSADAVNTASGSYQNRPAPDLVVRNPIGPSPIFARLYSTTNAVTGYGSPGLSSGWTHNYDYVICGTAGNWEALTLSYPNGATEWFSPNLNSQGVPTGAFTTPWGAPYQVSGVASATVGQWNSLTLIFKDLSNWTFTPSQGNPSHYLLTRITDIAGNYITLNYSGNFLSTITDDSTPPKKLMELDYNNDSQYYGNFLSAVKDYSDPNNVREVDYGFDFQNTDHWLKTVSQVYPVNHINGDNFTLAQYAYTMIGGQPFLTQVTVPDPSQKSQTRSNQINYNPATGQVSSLVDANQNQHVYTYGLSTQVKVEDSSNNVALSWTQSADMFNRDTGITDANSNPVYLHFTDSSNPWQATSFINRNGQTTFATCGQFGNLTNLQVPANGSMLNTMLSYNMSPTNPYGLLSMVTTGNKTVNLNYYPANYIAPNGALQPAGAVQSVQTPDPSNSAGSVTTSYVYTALGNIASITLPSPTGQNSTVTITYNYTQDMLEGINKPEALGEPLTVTVPINAGMNQYAVTHYRYDNRGNTVAVIDPMGLRTDLLYNAQDQVTDVYYPPASPQPPPNGETTSSLTGRIHTHYIYVYDGGPLQQIQLINESGTVFRSVYDTLGYEGETLTVNGDTDQSSAQFNPLYWLNSLADGDGSTHAMTPQYDAVGNLKQFNFANFSNSPNLNFDGFTGGYDADYNLVSRTDGLNRQTTYQLDNGPSGDDRLLQVKYPSGTLHNVSYEYDQYDRVIQRTDGTGVYTFAYNLLDQLTETQVTLNKVGGGTLPTQTISYTYNQDGSRAGMTTPAGTYSYTYNQAGWLTDVVFPWNSPNSIHYDYDLDGRLIHTRHSKGDTYYTYDNLNRLTDLKNMSSNPGAAVMSEFGPNMSYDAEGNRLTMPIYIIPIQYNGAFTADASGEIDYQYDNAGDQDDLISEICGRNNDPQIWGSGYTNSFQSDPADNLITLRGTGEDYNNDNQMAFGGSYADYDGEGNLNAGQYDIEDRLVNAYITGNQSVLSAYADDGHRAWKQAPTPYASPGYQFTVTTYFLYDGDQVVCELDQNGNLNGAYGYGASGLIQRQGGNSADLSMHVTTFTFDPQGTLVSRFRQLDPANQPYDVAAYDAFGQLLGDYYPSGSLSPPYSTNADSVPYDPVGYCGQWGCYTDLETGYVLMGSRYYSPFIARFLTRDPIGTEGGMNLYAYCRNNPVNYADPLGLDGVLLQYLIGGWKAIGNFLASSLVENDKMMLGPTALLIPDQYFDQLSHPFVSNNDAQANGMLIGGAIAFVGSLFIPGGQEEDAARLASSGEDLFVGTYGAVRRGNIRAGINSLFTPHHVVQDAVSSVSHDQGITINMRKTIHVLTETYGRPARRLPSLRDHLAADIHDLRGLLRQHGYDRSVVNRQLKELIRQNKALGGFNK